MKGFDFTHFSDEAFAAYVAGFTDGEGYIGLESARHTERSVVRIVLANCVPEVLFGIKSRLGYGAIRSQQQKPHWRERFTWSVANMADCEQFIRLVRPYLTIKAAVADAALARISEAGARVIKMRERNDAIRVAAVSGEKKRAIAQRYCLSPQAISRICEGHKWPSERSEFAKIRQRDHRGLFIKFDSAPVPA